MAAKKRASTPKAPRAAKVDWATLRTLDGRDAKRIVTRLRDLAKGGDKARFAASNVVAALLGVGEEPTVATATTCSAAPPALRAILRLAADPSIPDRDWLLTLAYEVFRFRCGAQDDDLTRGFDRAQSPWREAYASELGSALYAAARESVPELVGLLDDSDPQVRANALALLGSISECAAELAPVLAAHLSRETSPTASASAVVALYFVARYAPDTEPIVQAALISALHAEEPMVRGLALTVATVLRGAIPEGRDLHECLLAMLLAFAPYGTRPGYANPRDHREVFGWELQIPYWAIHLLGEPRLGLRAAVTEVLIEAARALEGRLCGYLPSHVVDFALRWHLERRDPARGLVAPSDLTDEQRALLSRLSVMSIDGPFAQYGLSPELRSRRRQLGFDPPGALEAVIFVDGVTSDDGWPAWRVVYELLRQREQPWEVVHAALLRCVPALRARDWLSIWFEAYGSKHVRTYGGSPYPYGVLWHQKVDLLEAVLASAPDEERLEWAATYHAELRRFPQCFRPMGCLILYELVVRRLRAGEEIPEEYDVDVAFGHAMPVRQVLERIPESRRLRLVKRLVESGQVDVSTASGVVDLAPELLTTLYENIERRKGSAQVRQSNGLVFNDNGEFVALLEKDARVREVHDAYIRRPPVPDQPVVDRSKMTLWP